ncbi:UDP-N-acetylglucosamine 1-carboxyvinyltransferase [Desulfobacterales bacterium HSG16]|nr:UDP-N-acetylglucosamine 1-carboxyvinyltransferase [Desulfobacterales bacterium HSG16]
MDKIVVRKSGPLQGEVKISGAKNAALPILVTSLLVNGENTYHNVPGLQDVESVKQLLTTLGARVHTDGHTVKIDGSGINQTKAPYDIVRKMRASILVLGPLLARMGKAKVSLPGGCAIGARPINLHLKGLARLGASIELKHGNVEAEVSQLIGNDIYFDVPTVTGTENLMMTAVLAKGETILRNAAREPEIIALADALNKMGAKIEGAGSSVISIKGVSALSPAEITIIPDRIEAGTFMVASALTRGDIKIVDCEPDHMRGIIHKLGLTGANIQIEGRTIRVKGPDVISSVDVKTLPYPGFPTDMQAQFMVLMSVAKGYCVISETIFENRFIHVSELRRLGADITVSGNSAMIKGSQALSGAQVMATDLRASASLILAGLVAEGSTEINRVYHLDRGYEGIEKKFGQLGADIQRLRE